VKPDQLTQETLDKVFEIYRDVTHSHAPRAILEEVTAALNGKGNFEWRSGPEDRWSSKLRIEKVDDSIYFGFVVNPELSMAMMRALDRMKQDFNREVHEADLEHL